MVTILSLKEKYRLSMHLLRPVNLILLAVTQFIAGAFLIKTDHYITLLLLVVSTCFITAAGYIINDYYDIKIDLINKPEKVVVGRYLSRRAAIAAHTLLNVAACIIGFYIYWKLGVLYIIVSFALWLYSRKLKSLPFLGNFIVATLTGLSVYLPAIVFPGNNNLALAYALFAFLLSFIREVIKDVEDLKGDEAFHRRTLPIVLGVRTVKLILYPIIALLLGDVLILAAHKGLYFAIYFVVLITLPSLWLVWRLFGADETKDFSYLSRLCKIIMFTGVLSMLFI